MSATCHSARIKNFVDTWAQSQGDEKGQTHSFWFSLLRDIFEVSLPEAEVQFEGRVEGIYHRKQGLFAAQGVSEHS